VPGSAKLVPEGPCALVTRLYLDLGPAVYRRCLRLLGNRAAAEDATQDVFLKFLREVDRLQDRKTLLPWVYRVASNHCLNLRREAAEHRQDSVGLDLDLLPGREGDGPGAFPERQLAQAVLECFDIETQAVAVAVLVDGMELEEVAAALGVSTRSVSKKLRRFIAGARQFLIEAGEVGPATAT
jgi:RNA polymerase sigma-70 factor (ECF subfamily)